VLSAEHCRARAERFRFWLLTAPDHATAARLRGFVERYNALAKRAEKAEALQFFAAGAAQLEDKMFGKFKGSSGEPLPPAPQLQNLATASSATLDTADDSLNSSIGPGMTVVGKISSEGAVNVFGRVEGELHASIVRISDGGQVEGIVAAQELSVGGRFKGTIHANRVALTSTAVVEGEIFHRCLAIEENAWFSDVSHPEESLIDASASAQV
jgi:cytoskeletal protein CcmA (bactofilin family)